MASDNDQFREPSSESLEAGYETSTVSVKALAIFVICLIVVAAIIHTGMWYLLQGYVTADARRDSPYSAITDEQFMRNYNQTHGTTLPASTQAAFPEPRLQPSPPGNNLPSDDLRDMYVREDKVFQRMGWRIDERNHQQLEIPPQVVSAVIRDESQRQQQEKQPR